MTWLLISISLGVMLSVVPKLSYVAQMFTTITHEVGHAVVVFPFGGKLSGIKLMLNTEGEATVSLPQYPFPFYHLLRMVNLFAGYSAPLYAAVLMVVIVSQNWDVAGRVLLVSVSLLVLVFIRNWFGLVVALLFAGVNLVFLFTPAGYLYGYLIFLATTLVVKGVQDIVGAGKGVFSGRLSNSDFHITAQEMRGTPQFWFVVFAVTQTVVFLALVWVLAVTGLFTFGNVTVF